MIRVLILAMQIVDAADGCDPGCELGGLPLSGAEVVEIEVGAA